MATTTDNDILYSRDDLLICATCGTQYGTSNAALLTSCRICDDPRQYVPPTGQSFTTLRSLRLNHTSFLSPHPTAASLSIVHSSPRLAIGQRALLVHTPAGNILWDCITLLTPSLVSSIRDLGGLVGIVISHPHFYSTHLLWAAVFKCPVYLASDDKEWLVEEEPNPKEPVRRFIDGEGGELEIPGKDGRETGAKAIKVGGHFPGSMVLLHDSRLLVGDTIMPTPSGVGDWRPHERPKGMNSFAFMWSYPNMIPLPPRALASMWRVLSRYSFTAVHAGFPGLDIEDDDVKKRVWESMGIQVGAEGGDGGVAFAEAFGLMAPL
ncbi:hypothetical protein VE01_09186 [Pseudogymnoascus verrucosus]|uniref:Metallo-beta-lactamase domain-containing protein n=1 Tax=Pseudogymnoascus verrucosus TaxID=342668 RepID=A0A1B8GBD8_9PEZI|nr:uncharacterized protein VE01_09186 [Pseudogymnoascus verrucosus]OBT93146.1 hypothetical protein VE01_09186 [Pseudogymnoascus verrucosus]